MVYPYYVPGGKSLKKKLIENRVYVATYWENMRSHVAPNSVEESLIDELVPLPIDQRMTEEDVARVLGIVAA